MMSEKPWVAYIEEEINNLVDLDLRDRVKCSMFRVPPSLRRVKPHLYIPHIVPFGLYNIERLRNRKMSAMDRLKLEVASVVLKIIKAPYTECYQHYDAALDCLSLPKITPNQLHPILSDLVSSLSRLPFVSRDSEGKLEMMKGRIAGLKAMAHAPGYELREREARLLSADLDSCFNVFVGFLDANCIVNTRKNWKWLCSMVVGDGAVVDLYDDVSDMYEGAARSLLTLDAIFLVGFMLSLHAGLDPESRITIEELGWFNPVLEVFRQEGIRCNIHAIAFDIWLMENQIPLSMIKSALECMWEVSNQAGSSTDSGKVLSILVRHAVKSVLHLVPGDCSNHSTSIDAVPISECKHLLECLYRVVCPSVTTSSNSCQQKIPKRVSKPSMDLAAELGSRPRGDVMRKTRGTTGSRSSSSLDVESRYPNPPGIAAPSSSYTSRANPGSDHPIPAPAPSLPTYHLFLPGYTLYPPTNSSRFPGFPLSPQSSPSNEQEFSAAAASGSHNKQYDQSPFRLRPLPQPPLPTSSNGSGYPRSDPFSSTPAEGLAKAEQRDLDRYGRSNRDHEPPATASSGWNDSHSSPVNTDDELETPFRSVLRSPSPLPVSDTMNMEDEGLVGTDHVEYTLADSRSRNNSYSTVTIDLSQAHVVKMQLGGGQSNFPMPPVSDNSAPFLNKLRTASRTTVRTVQSAGHWVGAPWRLFRTMFARRCGSSERKISSLGMYGSKGAGTFRDRDFLADSKPLVVTCPMSDMRIHPMPSATELRRAGIRCRSGSQVGCKPLLGEGEGYGVFKPTLFLPKLLVDESTERILQNLVAFELVSASEHELMSFLFFMNDLVKTEEDVQLLKQGEKAVLWLTSTVNDFEVITLFGNLMQNCHFTESSRLRDLRKELAHCYTRSWRHSFHLVIGTVCSKRWILLTLVAATFILVAVQTIYMLRGFYSLKD